ncbi:MAG: VOC family protein [Abitibacteriaceae bacterium]|nr:VOC family protein [Abditibacteriaceae bacterium]
MTQINAYLNFKGNCREVMTFYKECLGGELTLQTVEGSPIADQMPATERQAIVHSSLTKDGLVLMASDMMRNGVVESNAISLCLNCSSEAEIKTFFSNLAAGGQIIHPLGDAFWGGTFGHLTDKFGINWLLLYNQETNA